MLPTITKSDRNTIFTSTEHKKNITTAFKKVRQSVPNGSYVQPTSSGHVRTAKQDSIQTVIFIFIWKTFSREGKQKISRAFRQKISSCFSHFLISCQFFSLLFFDKTIKKEYSIWTIDYHSGPSLRTLAKSPRTKQHFKKIIIIIVSEKKRNSRKPDSNWWKRLKNNSNSPNRST